MAGGTVTEVVRPTWPAPNEIPVDEVSVLPLSAGSSPLTHNT